MTTYASQVLAAFGDCAATSREVAERSGVPMSHVYKTVFELDCAGVLVRLDADLWILSEKEALRLPLSADEAPPARRCTILGDSEVSGNHPDRPTPAYQIAAPLRRGTARYEELAAHAAGLGITAPCTVYNALAWLENEGFVRSGRGRNAEFAVTELGLRFLKRHKAMGRCACFLCQRLAADRAALWARKEEKRREATL